MGALGNMPRRTTVLTLVRAKSFAFGVQFKHADTKAAVDITGATVRLVLGSRTGSTTLTTKTAVILDAPAGLTQFDLQAVDLDLAEGEYPFAVTLVSQYGYSTPILAGIFDIRENADHDTTNTYTDVNPSTNVAAYLENGGALVSVEITNVDGMVVQAQAILQQTRDDVDAKNAAHTTEVNNLNAQHTTEVNNLNAQHTADTNALNTQHTADVQVQVDAATTQANNAAASATNAANSATASANSATDSANSAAAAAASKAQAEAIVTGDLDPVIATYVNDDTSESSAAVIARVDAGTTATALDPAVADIVANALGLTRAQLDAVYLQSGDAAGGALAGTFPNPSLADSAVTSSKVDASLKDPAAATAGLRTLGTGAQQAAAGNHTHVVVSHQVDVFSVSGTWAKPAGAKSVDVFVLGAGGGGGGGKAQGTTNMGSGGGGGAAAALASYSADTLPATVSVTVGAGGAGGTGGAATNGGTGGGSSFYGLTAGGGAGGQVYSGTMTAAAGGTAALGYTGGKGGYYGGSANQPATAGTVLSGGGGGLGGNSVSSTSGGAGLPGMAGGTGLAGGTAGPGGNPGTAGGAGSTGVNGPGGGGGGGGGGGTNGSGSGGDGGLGCGGGGGGACYSNTISGNGGKGGDGVVVVITHL